MRDHLAHRYFDAAHAILQATVGEDLPDLQRAVQALTRSVEKEDPATRGVGGLRAQCCLAHFGQRALGYLRGQPHAGSNP
jgi:hypothetical protein